MKKNKDGFAFPAYGSGNRAGADGSKVKEKRFRYSCHYNVRHPSQCDGQSGYGVTKLDAIVESIVCTKFSEILECSKSKLLQDMRDLVFGLIDCSVVMLFFIPLFGQQGGEIIRQVSLLSLQETPLFIKVAYFAIILLTVACGIATLALQNYSSIIWIKTKTILSMTLTIISVVIFIASLQPYVACFTFVLLIIKGALLLKRP